MRCTQTETVHEQVLEVVDTIRRYLRSRPEACDTIEGVATWWLPRQSFLDSLPIVQEALDRLESNGELIKHSAFSGKVMYRKPLRTSSPA